MDHRPRTALTAARLISIDMVDARAGPTREGLEYMMNGSGNDNHPQKRHPYLFYWLTGGLATIVAAIIGISVTHSSTGSVSNPRPSESAPVSPGSPLAGTSYTPPPSPTPEKQWGPGTIRITASVSADLDSVPPNTGNNVTGDDIYLDYNALPLGYRIISKTNEALWTSPGTPDAHDCANLISTQGIGFTTPLTVKQGSIVCVKTDQGNIAILTVQRLVPSSSDPADVLEATVWTLPS